MKKTLKLFGALGLAAVVLMGCGKEDGQTQESEPVKVGFATVQESIEMMHFDQALEQLEEIEITRGNRQQHYLFRGIAFMGQGYYEEAVEALETALSYNNGFVGEIDYDINRYLAAAYYHLGYYEEAGQVYKAIVDLLPTDAQAYYDYGVTLLRLDDYTAGKEAFEKAVSLEPDNYTRVIQVYEACYEFGYGNLGLEFVEAALTEGGADMNAYDKGRMLYHIGNYNEAISALEKVDKEQYARVSLYLGMSYEALGDFNYAANVYEAGLTENNDPAFYNQLGLCLMKCGKYEKALEAFQAGLDFEGNANRQALRFNEAVAYEYLADFDTAKRLMEAYLKDYPKDELARREYTFLESR